MADVGTFRWDPVDPLGAPSFGQDALVLPLVRPVRAQQLADEISARLGREVGLALITEPGFPPSEEHPARLHIMPMVEPAEVLEVLHEHRPDPDYGLDPAQRERAALRSRLERGEELGPEELRRALMLALSEDK